jgi:hypothetical protein
MDSKQRKALERAWQIRDFEIELYWKRAAYFWTFIAAAFVAFGVIATAKVQFEPLQSELLVLFSCLGFACSYSWIFVNTGSKFWQENWERHIDLLEDEVSGPLYKTVLLGPKKNKLAQLIGPGRFSVSSINTLISVLVTLFWGLLVLRNCWPPYRSSCIDGWKMASAILTLIYCVLVPWVGRSNLPPPMPLEGTNMRIINRSNEAKNNIRFLFAFAKYS